MIFWLFQFTMLIQFQQSLVSAHGYLTVPRSRNNEDYCAHCLNAGGPNAVYANNAYTHGMCGNNAADHPQTWNAADATQIEAIGQSGDSILVEVTVTAHHMGFFEFELCDSPDISEECFRERRLMRSNCDPDEEGELQCRRWWKPLKQEEYNHYSLTPQGYPDEAPYISGCSFVSFATYFDLPEDVDCTHCVLRWHYVTTNSCTSDDSVGEEFWNCADVSIEAPDGQVTTDTAPAEGYESMNERLTTKVPQDLTSMMVEGIDNWRCPNPAYGTPGEYFCGINGDVSGTDGCYAAQNGETCAISFYESNIEPVQEGIPQVSYCTWSGVCLEAGEGGSDWCDWDETNCDSCGGQWCKGWDLIDTTNDPITTTTQITTEPTTTQQITTEPTTTQQTTTKLLSTTALTTTTSRQESDQDYQELLNKISDMSANMAQLLSLAEDLENNFDETDCDDENLSALSSTKIDTTPLMLLSFSSATDYENDWTLVTDTGSWQYRTDYKAMMIRTGAGGSTTYAYTTVPNSDSFQHFLISATGDSKQLMQSGDGCRLEISSDMGASWDSQPVLQLDSDFTSGSETLVYTAENMGLMLRWIVEGNSAWETCFLQNIVVQGFIEDNMASDSQSRTRLLRGS